MLKKKFLRDVKNTVAPTHLVVATQLPTGAVEIQINTHSLREKIEYITNAYDEDFKLKTSPRAEGSKEIKVVGYLIV